METAEMGIFQLRTSLNATSLSFSFFFFRAYGAAFRKRKATDQIGGPILSLAASFLLRGPETGEWAADLGRRKKTAGSATFACTTVSAWRPVVTTLEAAWKGTKKKAAGHRIALGSEQCALLCRPRWKLD